MRSLALLFLPALALAQTAGPTRLYTGAQFTNGSSIGLAPVNQARLRYNLGAARLEVSISGGAYAALGGAGGTLATTYTTGASQTDSTVLLDSTRLGVRLRDNATPIAGSLFQVQNSGATVTYLDLTAASSQTLKSGQADGAGSVAAIVDTVNSFATGGAHLLSIRNAGTEQIGVKLRADGQFAIDFLNDIQLRTAIGDGASNVGGVIDTVNAYSTTGVKLLEFRTNNVAKLALTKLAADWAWDFVGAGFIRSGIADGASNVGNIIDTATAYSTTGVKILSLRTNAVEKLALTKTAIDWTVDFALTGSFRSNQVVATGPAFVFDTQNYYNALTNPIATFRTNGQLAGAFYTDTTPAFYVQGFNATSSAALSFIKLAATTQFGTTTAVTTTSDLAATLGTSAIRWTEVWGRRHAGIQPADVANAASVTFTIANGEVQRFLAGATAMTVSGQAGYAGEKITACIVEDATGTRTASFATGANNFKLVGGAFTLTATANKVDCLSFVWDTVGTVWLETGRAQNL